MYDNLRAFSGDNGSEAKDGSSLEDVTRGAFLRMARAWSRAGVPRTGLQLQERLTKKVCLEPKRPKHGFGNDLEAIAITTHVPVIESCLGFLRGSVQEELDASHTLSDAEVCV